MFYLPDFSKKLIEGRVDELFELISYWTLGIIPQGEKAKALIFSVRPPEETLTHLFVQAIRNRKPNQLEEDGLKGLIRGAEHYMEALKLTTKSRVVSGIESYMADQKKKNEPIEIKEVASILDGSMDKARKELMTIVNSEASHVRGAGNALDIAKVAKDMGVDDPTVYFVTMRDEHVCADCIRNHLMPDKITPRYYKLSEVKTGFLTTQERKNGEVAIMGLHPNCRCSMTILPPSFGHKNGKLEFHSMYHDALKEQRKDGED